MSTDAITGEAPTTELVSGAVGDRCPNCDTTLAADQRYCVSCGERRGRARYSFNQPGVAEAPAAPPAQPPRAAASRPGLTLLAGVATLLIAMGVGFVIGNNTNTTPAKAPAPYVVNVNGAGTAAGTNTAASNTAATSTGHRASKVKATKVHLTSKTLKAATQAASKVFGSSGNLSSNPTQSVGGACSGGAGCQGGKFSGNFFPGG